MLYALVKPADEGLRHLTIYLIVSLYLKNAPAHSPMRPLASNKAVWDSPELCLSDAENRLCGGVRAAKNQTKTTLGHPMVYHAIPQIRPALTSHCTDPSSECIVTCFESKSLEILTLCKRFGAHCGWLGVWWECCQSLRCGGAGDQRHSA